MQYRTHTCNELRLEDAGKQVRLSGWMEIIREVSAAGGVLIMAIGIVQARLLPIRLANQIPALPVAVVLAKLFL